MFKGAHNVSWHRQVLVRYFCTRNIATPFEQMIVTDVNMFLSRVTQGAQTLQYLVCKSSNARDTTI